MTDLISSAQASNGNIDALAQSLVQGMSSDGANRCLQGPTQEQDCNVHDDRCNESHPVVLQTIVKTVPVLRKVSQNMASAEAMLGQTASQVANLPGFEQALALRPEN